MATGKVDFTDVYKAVAAHEFNSRLCKYP